VNSEEKKEKEQQLRIQVMETQIERMKQEMKYESRKFLIQFLTSLSAAFGAGILAARFLLFHQ
jgi:hypothetical protein